MNSKKVDYNIEFAHIYVDEKYNREHLEGGWALKREIKKLEKNGKTCSSVVLFDDYNPSEKLLNEDNFLNQLKENNSNPDFVAYEAKLVPLYEKILDSVNHKSKRRSIGQYVETREKVPCSFLIVIWDLLRLGMVSNGVMYYRPNGEHGKPFVGEKIITILPERFRPVEDRARDVIANSEYKEALDRMEYIFF